MGAIKKSDHNEPLRIAIGQQNSGKSKRLNRVKTTKYTWLTFLPLNFYEQFRRAVYFYFLLVTIVSFFVNDTISPLTSLLPLLFVMIVTALKEGLEDYARLKSDRIVNTSKVTVIRNGQQHCINSEFIVPGDLVVVSSDGDVPCDLVLLQAADKKCFITTANLDGETNLKTIFEPINYPYAVEGQNSQLGSIVCEPASADLYSFNGRLELEANGIKQVLPLTIENVLLRGVRIKSTDRVIGCAVYTGMYTKLQLNSRYTGNKSASSEAYINKYILALIVGMVVVVIILYVVQRQKESLVFPKMSLLGEPINFNAMLQIVEDFLSFLLLFNYMVPISMYMNIELFRVFGAYFMQSDIDLYDSETDQRCVVNASNLNEDLGQVNILFSDKTGTLTKNEMNFLQCYVGGKSFELQRTQLYCPSTDEKYELGMFDTELVHFFEALCICHTVQVLESNTGKLSDIQSEQASLITEDIVSRYQASSPDEKAILEGCANLGLVFEGDNNNITSVRRYIGNPDGVWSLEELQYERLHVLEFSSERKRMSVIMRDNQGTIWLYCKGAESSIFPLCNKSVAIDQMDEEITKFAKQGLRTLAVARRKLTDDEFDRFMESYKSANSELDNRNELIVQCYGTVESGLDLLGATALEDALQDDVDATLVALQEAGVKIWVLTGDKVETALNIGLACKHIPPAADIHFMLNVSEKAELLQRLGALEIGLAETAETTAALVIDGTTITALLAHAPKEFCDVALKCKAVLCCRLSPLQKSEIVTLMKQTKRIITAAIGDGANDVSMIQEAHIGIGIMGREGRQAARCADYAIVKFCMLQRLLLVHGHYNSERLAFLVLFYCYKNIVITGCMALYQVHDLYSATSVYNPLYTWLFDIIYISFSFTYLAISEKSYSEKTLLSYPALYKRIANNKQTSWWTFTVWILNGTLHTLIIFYFAYGFMYDNNVILNSGQTADFACFGTMLIQMVVIVGNLKLLLVARFMSYVNFFIILASIAAFMLSTFIYNIATKSSLYFVYNMFISSLPIWLYTIVCTVACLLVDFAIKAINDVIRNPPPKVTKQTPTVESL